ncbi:MAG: hypothetical protein Q9175_006008 [Cornicularia normoerica]
MQDFVSLAASQARLGSIKAGKDEMTAIGPMLHHPSGNRRTSTRGNPPSLSSLVSDVVKIYKALNSQDPGPSEQIQQCDVAIIRHRSGIPIPVFQLSGTIDTICVKALPDIGSSQNEFDKNLIQRFFPSILIYPIHEPTDKLLVALDGQPIPCIEKYAKSLELTILPLRTSELDVKYADGRRGSMLGQVEVDWSFSDTPDKAAKVIFYVLRTCVHPVIFRERHIFSKDPWLNHEAALSDVATETAMIGVVGLEKIRRI